MRRVLLLACLVLFACGCKKPEAGTPVAPNPTAPTDPGRKPPAEQIVTSSAALNGTPLRESKDGPWVVRGTLAAQPETDGAAGAKGDPE